MSNHIILGQAPVAGAAAFRQSPRFRHHVRHVRASAVPIVPDSRAPSTSQPAAFPAPLMAGAAAALRRLAAAPALARQGASRIHTALPLLLHAAPFVFLPLNAGWAQLGDNYVFMVGFSGWFLAQFLKIFTKWFKTGVFSLKAFVDSGGMPSSHSALCSAVTTAVALQHGLSSSLFAVCTCFSVIVMYDAMGVRRHAGLQAEVINAVVNDLLDGHPISERKLKEVIGHTPRQVVCGALLGIAMGLVYPRPF